MLPGEQDRRPAGLSGMVSPKSVIGLACLLARYAEVIHTKRTAIATVATNTSDMCLLKAGTRISFLLLRLCIDSRHSGRILAKAMNAKTQSHWPRLVQKQ